MSDEQLLLAAYLRWGDEMTRHLLGDYAFVIADGTTSTVLAGRSISSLKPCFFAVSESDNWLVVASTPQQVLRTGLVDATPNHQVLRDYLAIVPHPDHSQTEFKSIHRLPAGYLLTASRTGIRLQRHVVPPSAQQISLWKDKQHCCHTLAKLVCDATQDRLRGTKGIVLQLSGGYDSAVLAGVLHELHANANRKEVALDNSIRTLTVSLRGTECDESEYVRAVVDGIRPFPHIETEPNLSFEDVVSSVNRRGTILGSTIFPLTDRCIAALGSCCPVTFLSGEGGDQLFADSGVLEDLWRRRHYLQYLRERRNWSPTGVRSAHGIRPQVPLEKDGLPAHLLPEARQAVRGSSTPTWQVEAIDFPLETQRRLWRRMVTTHNHDRFVECLALDAIAQGLEYRMPFLDQRLLDFMLAIPLLWRIPHGRYKGFLRDALSKYLPASIARRNDKTPRGSIALQYLQQWIPRFLNAYPPSTWMLREHVDPVRAVSFLRSVADTKASCGVFALKYHPYLVAWRLLTSEIWLRASFV